MYYLIYDNVLFTSGKLKLMLKSFIMLDKANLFTVILLKDYIKVYTC